MNCVHIYYILCTNVHLYYVLCTICNTYYLYHEYYVLQVKDYENQLLDYSLEPELTQTMAEE